MNAVDWNAVGAIAAMILAILAIAGGAVAYGAYRQKVKDLEERMVAQDTRLEKIELAIGASQKTSNDVALMGEVVRGFKNETAGAHQAILAEVRHVAELGSERMEGLRSEVRAFMQGQAVAAKRRAGA